MDISGKDAAFLFIGGQSNAHAHGRSMAERDRITEPMKNVFSLDRKENQSYDIKSVTWSHFTGEGKNLAETQDHTYSFASYFAKLWQDAVDCGKNLPDLYIVQISIGGQGIINGMWNKDKQKILVPGVLNTVNISLYSFAAHIHSLVIEDMKRFKAPAVLGWHWIGSEQDATKGVCFRDDFRDRYDDFFDGMTGLAPIDPPVYLYKLYASRVLDGEEMASVNSEFERQCERHKNFQIVDLADSPLLDESREDSGIFANDKIHYSARTQQWFADSFFEGLGLDKQT